MRRALPQWADLALVPLVNVAMAFAIAGLVVLAIGENPLAATRILLQGSLGSSEGIGFTLYYATDFIFTGLCVALAFQAGLFNIGGEGQATVAGLGAALVCLHLGFLPGLLLVPLGIAGAALAGAAWAFIPGVLQAKRGSHIVITTIMFNWLATALMAYLLVNVLREQGSMQPETRFFPAAAQIPKIADVLALAGLKIAATPLNLAFPLALLAAGGMWLLVWRTRLGYELRTLGASPAAASYAGMPVARLTVIALMISGALGGFLALNEVMGSQNHLALEFTSGYGFVGIAVALMGRSRSLGIVFAAILFGALYQGGTELAFDKPTITRDMVVLVQGLVILMAGALEHMVRPSLTRVFAGRQVLGQEA